MRDSTRHKIVLHDGKVELWLHEDHLYYSAAEYDSIVTDDDGFLARWILDKDAIAALADIRAFGIDTDKLVETYNKGAVKVKAVDTRFVLVGSVESAASIEDPDVRPSVLSEEFEFDASLNRIAVFYGTDVWIVLRTDVSDAYAEVNVTDAIDDVIKLGESIDTQH